MYVCIGITMKSHMVYVQILSVSTLVCDTIWVEYFIPAHVALLIPWFNKISTQHSSPVKWRKFSVCLNLVQ